MTSPVPPSYNPQIPTTDQNIAESQTNFLNNFMGLFNAFSVDHVPLNAASSPGNHNVIEAVEQPLGLTTQSQEICIYSKKVNGQTDQLFMRYPSNGLEFQLTQYQIYPLPQIFFGNVLYQIPFFSILPGGIIVYFGTIIPFADSFYISLNPSICSNIISVNLGVIGVQTGINQAYQSNVAVQSVNGKFTSVLLTNSTVFGTPPSQYYLIFGNI